MPETNKIAMRPEVVHYLNGYLCGNGWTKFGENPGANTEDTLYINMSTASSETTDYKATYNIEADLMYTEESIAAVYDIAANRKIGSAALLEHIKIDTFSGDAWKESVAVAISSFDGEKKMKMTGTLNVRGDALHGTWTSGGTEGIVWDAKSIAMKTQPTKTTYSTGDALDVTGAKITVTELDNTSEDVNVTSAMCSGFDSTTAGTKTVTVTYRGQTTTFTVTVTGE